MAPQCLLSLKWVKQTLRYLVKAFITIPSSLQKLFSIWFEIRRLLDLAKKLGPGRGDKSPNPASQQPPCPDTNSQFVRHSALPLRVVEEHAPTVTFDTTASEPSCTTSPSRPGSAHESSDQASSITEVSRPVPYSILSPSNDQITEKPPEVPSAKKDKIVCVTPQEYERYSRTKLDKIETDEFILPSLKRSYTSNVSPFNPKSRLQLPSGWTYHIHPEGAPYFYNRSRRILTDFYLYDEVECRRAQGIIDRICGYMTRHKIDWPDDTELVIEPRQSGNVGYYFADHINQVIFWLQENDVAWELKEVKVKLRETHVGHWVRSHYWRHNELFPHVKILSTDVIEEISGTLIHAIGDSVTSSVSLSPYSLESLRIMLDMTRESEKQQKTQHWVPSACILYRFMATFDEQRFLNLHGERGARLSRDQSIHEEVGQTLFFKFLSPLLLSAPSTHLKKLQAISVDSLVNQPSWLKIKEQSTKEWQDSALVSTVLLAANVGFLAIQSVDQENRTNAQRASYVSVLMSMGAIIFGLLLTRQHQHTFNMHFLACRGVSVLGFETLALMYSLPFVFSLWGALSFLAAFSFMCYTSNDTLTYILMSAAWFGLVLLLLWCISTSFETSAYFYPLPIRLWKRLECRFSEWRTSRSQHNDQLKTDVEAVGGPELGSEDNSCDL